ncbi:hypothetical protein ACLB2K_006140 [Fragaria x ananassa]
MHKHVKVAAGRFVLPPELWEEIYKRLVDLVLSDRIRFSSLGLISPDRNGPPPVTELWPLLNHSVAVNSIDKASQQCPRLISHFTRGKYMVWLSGKGSLKFMFFELDLVLEHLYAVRGIAMKGIDKAYLVESRGELLIVREHYKNFDLTAEFEVFKLVMANGFADAVKLESLGDQALFCGSDGCISLAVGEFSLFEENHIYFIACPLTLSCQSDLFQTFYQSLSTFFYGLLNLLPKAVALFGGVSDQFATRFHVGALPASGKISI